MTDTENVPRRFMELLIRLPKDEDGASLLEYTVLRYCPG